VINSSGSPIRSINKNPRGAPLEVRQHQKLHGASKTKEALRERWQRKHDDVGEATPLPKCKSLPQYYQSTYANHGRIPGWKNPPLETPVSLLGELPPPAKEGKYGLGLDEPHFKATYDDLGQGFQQKTWGAASKHHSMSMPTFPDVQDVARWRPGVGPPKNPDPAHEAKFFKSTYMNHGEGFIPPTKGQPAKLHNHAMVGAWCGDADKTHGKKHKWEVLSWRPGVGDPVNPDPAKEAQNFSNTYAELGNWHKDHVSWLDKVDKPNMK
jgi:hypothetical protein